MACAKLLPDWLIIVHVRAIHNFHKIWIMSSFIKLLWNGPQCSSSIFCLRLREHGLGQYGEMAHICNVLSHWLRSCLHNPRQRRDNDDLQFMPWYERDFKDSIVSALFQSLLCRFPEQLRCKYVQPLKPTSRLDWTSLKFHKIAVHKLQPCVRRLKKTALMKNYCR